MKTIYHRILAATALCLAALGLSSCYSTIYRYAWDRARIIDEAYWVQDSDNIELYRVGDTVYAKAFLGPARGEHKDAWRGNMLCLRGGSYSCYTPIAERSKPVYIRLISSYSEHKSELQKNRQKNPECYRDDVFHVWWSTPECSPYLTSLPAGAIRLKERGEYDHYISESNGYKPHTDAHKYYAYPLGGITAVAVDAPLTLAGNALLLAAGAVMAVTTGPVVLIYDACTQNAAETTPTPKSTTPPPNSPST